MGLIMALMLVWFNFFMPKPPEPTAEQAAQTAQDSIQNSAQKKTENAASAPSLAPVAAAAGDSNAMAKQRVLFGDFAAASVGDEKEETLENDFVKIAFSSKGGRIKSVLVKKYERVSEEKSTTEEVKAPLFLLEDSKNRFSYTLPVAGSATGKVETGDLFFTAKKSGQQLIFSADAGAGRSFEQIYTLAPEGYEIGYEVKMNGLNSVFQPNTGAIRLNWVNFLDKLEKNATYESQYSSVFFKPNDDDPDYCDCRKDDTKNFSDQPLKWISHSNQFFNTTILAESGSFRNAQLETRMVDVKTAEDLKMVSSSFDLPLSSGGNESVKMKIYSGPNEFDRLQALGSKAEDIIPFGASIFGTINRWVIHPVFVLLLKIIGSAGISILVLTLLVKAAVYPLTYKMVHSQAKQTALKPQIDALKKKFGDDQQKMSMESMKLYQEYGVNPVGGCLPLVLQMPIWFALYRFFPASIEFRQQSFLWATDLSSYDAWYKLPFEIFGAGHISLFTVIWTLTTLWYTWYTMKQMENSMVDNAQMQMMKYMQYAMPVVMFFFFNTFASGLSCYLSFSNLLNVGQTLVTKKFLIDHEKIKKALEANKNKPKTGFGAKLSAAMQEAQKVQAEKEKAKGKK